MRYSPPLLLSVMANSNFRIELAPEVTLTETEGKIVLFSKKTGDFFGLNESAVLFIKELSSKDYLHTLQTASKTFAVPESELASDILELVAELEKQKLLKKIPVT